MSHGSPDWGASRPVSTIYQVSDLSELAARLGSIVTFDRRGDVVWLDNFEDNINKWDQSPTGAGAAIALDTDRCRSGGKSCKLTTGNLAGNSTYIHRSFGASVVSAKLGIELSFTLHPFVTFYLYIEAHRPPTAYRVTMKYDPVTNILAYQKFNGFYEDLIVGLDLEAGTVWHTMKLVGDFSVDGFYERVILNNLTPDIQGIPSHQFAAGAEDKLRVVVMATTQSAANNSLWIDDMIVTQNEP